VDKFLDSAPLAMYQKESMKCLLKQDKEEELF
jgi:hypothetical protein